MTTSDQNSKPIDTCLDNWHAWLNGNLEGGLDAVLHEDCVFLSPIVFSPQVGREITKVYLNAAARTFGDPATGDDKSADSTESTAATPGDSTFRYVKEIRGDNQAFLEFESTVEGKYVNGADIITCDDNGLITEFKVMLRPLQAINLMHAQMKAMLEQIQDA